MLAAAFAIAGLTGCARDHPVAAASSANVAKSVDELATEIPDDGPYQPRYRIDVKRPLTIDQIGLLAMLNNAELQIGKAAATREQLHAKYQASLDDAVATTHGLIAQIHQLSGDLVRTREAAARAKSMASAAIRPALLAISTKEP